MGGKQKQNLILHSNTNNTNLPFVSVCTPTFNRRPFIPAMIECFQHQDYPKDRMEWIIIDDGTDKIEDLVIQIPQVKYFKYDKKMSLGQKRNLMHDKSKGAILVYMDDDDYYPPERVSHAVTKLNENSNALCAGSSIIHIWFKHINKMWQFGPYGPNHATAGTFAFKRELLKITRYDDDAALAEERAFLKNYTIPFVQLDSLKSILCFSHQHNTFDKKKLLDMYNPSYSKPVELQVETVIHNKELLDFYKYKIDNLLDVYEPGKPEMKPDVLKQIIEIEKKRKEQIENHMKLQSSGSIVLQEQGKEPVVLNNNEVVALLSKQTNDINGLFTQLQNKDKFIELLKNKVQDQSAMINLLKNEINELNVLNRFNKHESNANDTNSTNCNDTDKIGIKINTTNMNDSNDVSLLTEINKIND
jgi:glycosyltransferase involved in cell wall biosynthesis